MKAFRATNSLLVAAFGLCGFLLRILPRFRCSGMGINSTPTDNGKYLCTVLRSTWKSYVLDMTFKHDISSYLKIYSLISGPSVSSSAIKDIDIISECKPGD